MFNPFRRDPSNPRPSEPSYPRPYGGYSRVPLMLERMKKIDEDAAKAGYNDVSQYLDDRLRKNPIQLKITDSLYRQCVAEEGAESDECKRLKEYWLECKEAQTAGIQGNQEEVRGN